MIAPGALGAVDWAAMLAALILLAIVVFVLRAMYSDTPPQRVASVGSRAIRGQVLEQRAPAAQPATDRAA